MNEGSKKFRCRYCNNWEIHHKDEKRDVVVCLHCGEKMDEVIVYE